MNFSYWTSRTEAFIWANRTQILIALFTVTMIRFWLKYEPDASDVHFTVSDMLINYADGLVRRGLLGEFALNLTSLLGWTATGWAMLMTTFISFGVLVLSLRIYRTLGENSALLPLILAPWGLAFAAYDQHVFYRKEYIGFLALALILWGILNHSSKRACIYLACAVLLFPLAILAHEANAVLAGGLLVAALLMSKVHPDVSREIGLLVGFAIIASVVALLVALTHRTADPSVICAAIGDSRCGGPFPFLGENTSHGNAFVRDWMSERSYFQTGCVIFLSSLPFIGLRARNASPSLLVIMAAAFVLPVVPLFFVGIDFGRWVHMIFFPASLVMLTAIITGPATYKRIMPPFFALIYCGTWGIVHVAAQIEAMGLYLWVGVGLAQIWALGAYLLRGLSGRIRRRI